MTRRAAFVPLALALLLGASSCALPPPQAPGGAVTRRPPPIGEAAPVRPQPFRPTAEPMVDVGMAWDMDSVNVGGGDLRVSSRELSSERRFDAVHVELGPIGLRLGAPGDPGSLLQVPGDDTVWIAPGDPARGLTWNGKTWRGTIRVFLNPRRKVSLAIRVPLETYLLGVVPTEIGGLTPALLEAGKAQAVAARSYTMFYRGRRAAEGFDLYGTVEDQMYGPMESERALASRCVQETHGRFMMSEDQPIRANYCANCGGITAEVWEAWPTPPQPYLVSHLDGGSNSWCAASPLYRWREEWKPAEFAANLAQYGPMQSVAIPRGGVGEILDVRVGARSRSGRVWWLDITTSTGEIIVPAYAVRFLLRRPGMPTAILRSNLFKIDVRRDRRTHRALAIVASGGGSGHGVGLCQTGALGMARAGTKYAEILRHYYPGAHLERFY